MLTFELSVAERNLATAVVDSIIIHLAMPNWNCISHTTYIPHIAHRVYIYKHKNSSVISHSLYDGGKEKRRLSN